MIKFAFGDIYFSPYESQPLIRMWLKYFPGFDRAMRCYVSSIYTIFIIKILIKLGMD